MKLASVFSTFASIFFLIYTAHANDKVTGQDWLLMSRAEKGLYIFTATDVLKSHHVPLSKSPAEYSALIDAELLDNPNALKSDVTNILATVVSKKEPDARQALQRLVK